MKGIRRGVFAISFMIATAAAPAARAGVIEGTVRDARNAATPLVGVNVRIVGTSAGASTDLDGRYAIRGVPDGTYSLRVFGEGYATKVITGVTVKGDATTTMDIKLETVAGGDGDAQRIEDTYVTAERVTNTQAAILMERQRSAVIGDGISAEQIRLSPDGTSSEALKRVTGLSIVDDKFVFVRGVTDRYNSTTLNGVAVTGTDTDTDKKSFSFDLIPAQLISNTVVVKTATPDLPGDFSGGLVQVNTLDFPSDLLVSAGAEIGHDEASSKQGIFAAPGGGEDWKARDDGSRAFPQGVEGNDLAKALPNNWATSPDESRRNQSYGLAVGNRFGIGGGELGVVASGTYKDNYKVEAFTQEPAVAGVPVFKYSGDRYRHKYLIGGLLNLTYRPWRSHKISIENNYSRTAEDKVIRATGVPESGDSARVQTIEWDERDLYLGQVAGAHEFAGAGNLRFDWRASLSDSKAQEPDRKYVKYQRDPRGNYLMNENYRTWSALEEDTRGVIADVTKPFRVVTVKAGYLYSKRERSFDIEAWATDASRLSRPNRALVVEPIETIFSAENYGEGKFQFIPWSPFTGVYDGTQTLNAYYGMVDAPFGLLGQSLRFAGGARVEDSDQVVTSPVAADDPTLQTAQIDRTDVLPSANLTWQTSKTTNVRLGYFASVNRPEFREMANVYYLDTDANQGVLGNPDLTRAFVRNYDVRAEWFPGVGEVLAVSWFHKDLTDAIEEQLLPSPDRYVRTWFNSPEGTNVGWEIEARKNLGFLWGPLEDLVVQANYTKVESEVEYTDAYTDAQGNEIFETKTRTMQGQAPYTVNAGLVYSIPDIGLSMSLL